MERKIKGDGSPVTKTDLAINRMVVEEVQKNFPGHGVLGEEESSLIADAEFTWVCDPVDGTIPFSHGTPTCVFSLGLTQKGNPILGVAYDPFLDRMFFAQTGLGSTCNGQVLTVSKKDTLAGAYVSSGIWKGMHFKMPLFMSDLVFREGAESFPMGSVVYNAALLAAGEIDGVIFSATTAHDIAAAKVIVEEAGGTVTDLYGNDQHYDKPIKGAILSNGLIHGQLIKLVGEHLKV